MSADSSRVPFDPSRYVTRLRGGDYLEVKYRLLWFRQEHPDGVVETELVEHRPAEYAVFRCRVIVPGGGSATGWGSETARDFADYLEKAETKAIGRALAALGYGTQFAIEFSEPELADSPVDAAAPQPPPPPPTAQPPATGPSGYADRVTEKQKGLLWHRWLELMPIGTSREEATALLHGLTQSRYGCGPGDLTKRQASELIDLLSPERRARSVSFDEIDDVCHRLRVPIDRLQAALPAFFTWDSVTVGDLLIAEARIGAER